VRAIRKVHGTPLIEPSDRSVNSPGRLKIQAGYREPWLWATLRAMHPEWDRDPMVAAADPNQMPGAVSRPGAVPQCQFHE
jgi:hypothetical protein